MSIEQTKLKDHFPMIRDRSAIMDDIKADDALLLSFKAWSTERQELFLDICSGTRGVKMLYDSPFKEVLNPEHTPGRLSSFLSELLGKKVTVKMVLPNDSERIGDELTLVITDIVVELEDGSIANIEVQKIGYKFPGERASCYSADLLLRQYKRVRDERKEAFSYRDLAPVYTIVFMEKSPQIFYNFPDVYVHYISEASNTGIKLNMLQNFIFIPVDIFINKLHNEGINSKLDAWLTFLGCDEPKWIIKLIELYPEFEPLYSHLYDYCRNIEGVMKMFSEELRIMDRNTVKLMIDELQEELDSTIEELDNAKEELGNTKEELGNTKEELGNTKEELGNTREQLAAYQNKEKTLSSEITRLIKLLDDNGIKH